MNKKDIVGKKFGSLTVIKEINKKELKTIGMLKESSIKYEQELEKWKQ